jgi:hypothetical protein
MRLWFVLLPCLCTVASAQGLFVDRTPLTLRLETDLHALFRDRGDQRKEHSAVLRYGAAPDTGSLAVKLRTRGIFRLKRCSFPPLRVNLPKKLDDTPFAGQNRLKLVTHCQGDRAFERNLLREYALYRVFNALTDTSFRVRLAHVTYTDSARSDTATRYAFFIESDSALARRAGAEVFAAGNVNELMTEQSYMTLVAVFQYLIGNTDWSVLGRHNILVLHVTSLPFTLLAVPYDYDFSGAVNASYATPPPQIPIRSVRERYYRGFCQPDSVLMPVLERFRTAKDSIYAAVQAVPDLPERDVRGLLEYFDDFYRTLGDRAAVERAFVRGCRALPR